MKRDQRFPVVMSESERKALSRLAQIEALPAAAVVRRLIIREAKRLGVLQFPCTNGNADRRRRKAA